MYGALGLGQAIQNATNVAWSVPRNRRPNPVLLRLKSLLLLILGGLAVLAITTLSILASHTEVLGESISCLPVADPARHRRREHSRVHPVLPGGRRPAGTASAAPLPGAFAVAVLWQGLQYVGTWFVQRVLDSTSEMNQTFGLVLGLIGIIFIAAIMGVLGIEVNVVLERRLWPRALLALFKDDVDLTDADRKAYSSYVLAQRHKTYERIELTWDRIPVRHRSTSPTADPDPDPRPRPRPRSRPGSAERHEPVAAVLGDLDAVAVAGHQQHRAAHRDHHPPAVAELVDQLLRQRPAARPTPGSGRTAHCPAARARPASPG